MENVLVAVVIIFLVLFGVLTLSTAFLNAQDEVFTTWDQVQSLEMEIISTHLTAHAVRVLDNGALVEPRFFNTGSVRLTDFDRWDVIIDYCDEATPSVCQSQYLEYNSGNPAAGEWSVEGLYTDPAAIDPERFDQGIFNPDETLVLHLRPSSTISLDESFQVTAVTPTGIRASLQGTRNAPPVLNLNLGIRTAANGSTTLDSADLSASDVDNAPDEILFSIFSAPAQGSLSTGSEFSQAQLEAGDVVYSHTGVGDDSFQFFMNDGIDVLGPYTVTVTLNTEPTLVTNTGLVVPLNGTAIITSAMLQATDTDTEDVAARLVYTVTQFPANGTLSLGTSFTQEDIDSNTLSYTHLTDTADLFKFVVSDGFDVIGEFTFIITTV
jgi:hypothetical protein